MIFVIFEGFQGVCSNESAAPSGDGISNKDNGVGIANTDQADLDADGIGGTRDNDIDGDAYNDTLIVSPMSYAYIYVDGKRKLVRKYASNIEVRSGKNGQLWYGKEAGEQFG